MTTMLLPLRDLKPSPHHIRKTWDDESLSDLARSIKEHGLIAPVKVRPNGKGYELVYGHRRTEAARQAGLKEVEAVVEPLGDLRSLDQQIIENETREDVPYREKAEGYRTALEAHQEADPKYNVTRLAASYGIPRVTIYDALKWLRAQDEGWAVVDVDVDHPRGNGVGHILEINTALGDDIEAKRAVAAKARAERLGRQEIKAVATEYKKAAGDPVKRAAVLETPARDVGLADFERKVRVTLGVTRLMERAQAKKRQEDPREVKKHLVAIRDAHVSADEVPDVVRFGKYSQEAARFAIRVHNDLVLSLLAANAELSKVTNG